MTTPEASYPELVVAIVGPTAVGKSEVAIELATALGGQIVNADAFQVYRGMDIGTAKVPASRRAGVVHHLIDVVDVSDDFGVARYQLAGREALRNVARTGRPAVIVGGSGLYVRGLLDDLRFPGTDPEVRARWEGRLLEVGPQALHDILAQRDPAAAAAILPGNARRVVRALEVIEMTGAPFQARLPKSGPQLVPHVAYGLTAPLDKLDRSIAVRVADMMKAGLVDEVAGLVRRGLTLESPAGRAIGYRQVLEYFAGRLSLEEAVASVVLATSQYARRQLRWFRADPRIHWYQTSDESGSSTASQILSHIEQHRA